MTNKLFDLLAQAGFDVEPVGETAVRIKDLSTTPPVRFSQLGRIEALAFSKGLHLRVHMFDRNIVRGVPFGQ